MGEKQTVTLERALEINEAVGVIQSNSLLEAKVTYRIGILGDKCKSPVRHYNKAVEEARKQLKATQKTLRDKLVGKNEEEKKEVTLEMQEAIDKFNEDHTKLLEEQVELTIPTFKLSEFTASQEIKGKDTIKVGKEDKEIEIVIREGQTLVPVKFFALMGDFVKE